MARSATPSEGDGERDALVAALGVDVDDPEVMHARASLEARLFGVPLVPTRIGRFLLLERIGAGGMGIVYAAFDPELERKVALKFLFDRGAGARERERLRREAKAMAKLAHPNVVHVYEVGEHRGRIFLAMEYVRGATLRAWASQRPRSTREVIATCVQAGRGLAAAHRSGVVHGDFKPDNVLVGEDGRVRVLDFGLARHLEHATASDQPAPSTHAAVVETTTRTQRVRGTPGYLCATRLRGEPADRGSDVFAFCVTVWEVLSGTKPYVADTVESMRDAIASGHIEAVPRARMPAWVERVLRRGLVEPRDRRGAFETVDAVLDALERDPAQTRRRWSLLGGAIVALGGAFFIGSTSGSSPMQTPCTGAEAAIVQAWPADDRAAALARIEAVGGEYGKTVVPRIVAELAAWQPRWIAAHREACLAHARGEQSADILDRRMMCLHRGHAALAALGDVTENAPAEALPGVVQALVGLPDPDECSNVERLARLRSPPPAAAAPLIERHAAVRALADTGRFEEAAEEIEAVVEDVRAFGFRPLLAEALRTHARIVQELRDRERALPLYEEALTLALSEGDDGGAVYAWGQRAWILATSRVEDGGDPFEGRALMLALSERDPVSLPTMSLYMSIGGAEIGRGRPDAARAAYLRAVEIGEALGNATRSMALAKQQLGLLTEDPAQRDAVFEEAVALWTEALGAEHPTTFDARVYAAMFIEEPTRALERLLPLCAELRTLHPHRRGAIVVCERATVPLAELVGDVDTARAAIERWAEVADPDDDLAKAKLALVHGDPAAAVSILEPEVNRAAQEITESTPWWARSALGGREIALGQALWSIGDERAAAFLSRGLSRIEASVSGKPQVTVRRDALVARALVERTRASGR